MDAEIATKMPTAKETNVYVTMATREMEKYA